MLHSYIIPMLTDMCLESEFQIAYKYEAESVCFKSVFHVRV